MPGYDVVIPTTGRRSLGALLAGLGAADGPLPENVVIADDRERPEPPLEVDVPPALAGRVRVVRPGHHGPAAARNAGWRAARCDWVAFLDDDVIPEPGWRAELVHDISAAAESVAGTQGRVKVVVPDRPTDFQRSIAGLRDARWATADMAFRRRALWAVGGFDERFPRAYREDAEIAVRMQDAGYALNVGTRAVLHPAYAGDRRASLRRQAGNSDDALMRALHGRRWRERAQAPRGRLALHALTVAFAAGAAFAALLHRPRLARAGLVGWALATAEFATRRILPGPRDRREVGAMLATSATIPFAALAYRAAGELRAARDRPRPARRPVPELVLFDRDGTLVEDVPFNGDPALVRPMPGAREAIKRLRAAGARVAIVSNQAGIARRLLDEDQVAAVMNRVDDLLGPFHAFRWCPHDDGDGCECRKPRPGMLLSVARELEADPARCVMIGDIAADTDAAAAAGMRAILVPTHATAPGDLELAAEVAPDLPRAVDLILGRPEESAR